LFIKTLEVYLEKGYVTDFVYQSKTYLNIVRNTHKIYKHWHIQHTGV